MRRTIAAPLGTVVVLAGLAAIAPSSQAHPGAQTHIVWPGHSLQSAVDRAKPGDTLRLKAGHYDGGILVRKPLTIRGEGNNTIIRPGRTDHCAKAKVPGMGICVVGRPKHPVTGVFIKQVTVQGFRDTGVYGNYTDRMKVLAVLAKKNGEYGIAQFNSTRGELVWNWTIENRNDAGLYVGDTANAQGTEVAWNNSSGNALGLLVRHARHIKVHDNNLHDNCTGIALVDDGQRTGQGNTKIWKNTVSKNNKYCPPHGPAPALNGTGILFFGGDHNEVVQNTVHKNQGKLAYSGGIVLFRGVPPLNRPAAHNLIKANNLRENTPYDLVNRSGSKTNRFVGNSCRTSSPPNLC
ncbi:parallel beta helix pectate lyase-like protein [Actinomadura pelletieri DSM 43383]|uniref:Parallel beta helix pectate lyase-like protein n=1 Tax=Actinomadura pelletieri DSM 43383 TaxID=1120940 RepID=A0A495QAM5_9ACTN|nr:right-handed parallel beta-helix repeat-containing protein [Actinomadura pelletieri]RKS68739.1 parallel beta helix pectate lyase-like protein [Actinomadura pelletieri DSM 43383]